MEAVVSIVNTGHPSVEVQIEVGVMRRTDYFGFAVVAVLRKVAHCPKLAVATRGGWTLVVPESRLAADWIPAEVWQGGRWFPVDGAALGPPCLGAP